MTKNFRPWATLRPKFNSTIGKVAWSELPLQMVLPANQATQKSRPPEYKLHPPILRFSNPRVGDLCHLAA